MTNQGFVELVRKMRGAQAEYFRQRSQSSLVEAKRLERLVDTELLHLAAQKQDQEVERER